MSSDHLRILVGTDSLVARAAAQKVQGSIVRDAKQPSLGIGQRSSVGYGLDCFQQRFLDDVLAVDYRSCHARAVTMQLRPQPYDKLVKCLPGCRVSGRLAVVL